MDPRLRLHNAVIGLAHPNPPWPIPLAEAGYRIARIEQPVGTRLGSVTIDLLFVAEDHNALLAVECKEGTVQHEQAQKYGALEPLDIVQTGSVGVRDPTAAVLDVAYAVGSSRATTTIAALDGLALSPGVLSIGPTIEWHRGQPTDPRLRSAFTAPVPADLRAVPRLLLVDDASHPSMLAAELANELHAAIEGGRESISVEALLENACWGWARYGRAFQGQFQRGVLEMLRQAEKNELKGLISVERAGRQSGPTVRIAASNSEATTQAGALRGARAVRARLNSFVARAAGKSVPEILGQMSFEAPDEDLEEDADEDL